MVPLRCTIVFIELGRGGRLIIIISGLGGVGLASSCPRGPGLKRIICIPLLHHASIFTGAAFAIPGSITGSVAISILGINQSESRDL